ncbi:MAG: PAS domain S-box protein, partial [Gemmatimonas sp.]
VVVSLRDVSLNPTLVATVSDAGGIGGRAIASNALKALPGAVWRRTLAAIDRYRVHGLHMLDGSDPWVAREFFGAEVTGRSDGTTWLPTDLLVSLLHGAEGELLGIVKLAAPHDGRRPGQAKRREIEALTRHLSSRLAYDAIRSIAKQRAARLQRLQETGAAFARSLDEREIIRELGRQAMRATNADGVTISAPDLDQDLLVSLLCIVRGAESVRAPVPLGDGLTTEVARSGRPVRIGDREADRARERAGLSTPASLCDVVGESGAATSVLAVPMLAGIQLLGVLSVHAIAADVFSEDDEEVLVTMASQAATAIANARRYDESERERRQTEALADVARAVGESLRLGEVLRLILRHSVALLGAEGACVALRNNEYLHIVAAIGAADVLAGVHLPVATSLLGRTVTSNQLLVSNDFGSDASASSAMHRLASVQRAVIAPLMTARGTIGALSVINREAPFTIEDSRVLQRLADHVAVAIVNARMFEEIERATREWKVAFDSIPTGMVVLEEDMSIRRCNARAAELCGVTIQALLGKRFVDALVGGAAGAEHSAIESLVQRANAEGQAARDTIREGLTGRLYSMHAAPHPDGGCVLTFDDVTATHRLAEQHRSVLETVSDAIVITSLDGRVTFANAAAHALFQRQELVGLGMDSLAAPESLPDVMHHECAARDGSPQRYECGIVPADGAQRLVAVSTAPQFELGQVTGTVACLRDITGLRADSVALAQSEARYQQLVESASDAIFTVDLQGRFATVNRGVLDETGRTREGLIGAPCTVLFDPRDHVRVAELLQRTASGERQRMELRYIDARGATRVGLLTTDAIRENGVVVGGLGIMRDTTDDVIERESDAQYARLSSLQALLGGVANEIRNPLNALLSIAELEASSPTLGGHDRRVLEQIRDEARRAARVVSDVLASALDRPSERTIVDMNRVVRSAMELQGYGLRNHGIQVVLALAPSSLNTHADGRQLQQAIVNLLANAEEAVLETAQPRRILVESAAQDALVTLRISDTGPGIADAIAANVFEPMFSTRSARGGRGLGLTIAQGIVVAHGGTVEVSPAARGTGACFTITLPRATAGADAALHTTPTPFTHAVPRGQSVLIVEDEASLRTAVGRFLERQGYDVALAADGTDALALLQQRSFALVLLDLRMRGLSGEDTYREILRRDVVQAEHVLFITGDLHSPSASAFLRSTGRHVMAKPFSLTELETRVATMLRSA